VLAQRGQLSVAVRQLGAEALLVLDDALVAHLDVVETGLASGRPGPFHLPAVVDIVSIIVSRFASNTPIYWLERTY